MRGDLKAWGKNLADAVSGEPGAAALSPGS